MLDFVLLNNFLLWFTGFAAASACGSSWTFLFTFLHVTLDVFVLCGKPFQVCQAWKGTLKSPPVHSFNGVIISSARACTLQSVFAFPIPFGAILYLIMCRSVFYTTRRFMFGLALLFVYVFLLSC